MPFESNAQRKWMFKNKPEMAKEWAAHTPKGKKLPEHVKKSSDIDFIQLPEFTKIAKKLFNSDKNPPVKAAVLEARDTAPLVQNALAIRVAKAQKAAQAKMTKKAALNWDLSITKASWVV
jgi:hypothetical protein